MRTLLICLLTCLICLMICLPWLAACSLTDAWVEADRLTFEAIAPEYQEYVEADDRLDEDQKQSRRDTVETWRLRIEAAREDGP